MASPSKQHSTVINTVPKGNGTFPRFFQLPHELRSQIWEQSLCHERLIRVELITETPPKQRYKNNDWSSKFNAVQWILYRPSKSFFIVLRNRHEISKLFRVCYESRKAAQRFYRVKVPCFYQELGRPASEGILYFHPELDILDISGQGFLPRFAHMLWEHDRRGVGLVNLALARPSFLATCDWLFLVKKDGDLLRPALSRLRRVIFGYDGYLGRGVPDMPYRGNNFEAGQMFRPRPLLASVSKFQTLQKDPRSIKTELKKVFMGCGDPRDQMYRWFRLLQKWDIKYPDHTVDYRFMITVNDRRVENLGDAALSLQRREKEWARLRKSYVEDGGTYQEADETLPAAYGFWLFPIDAFGAIPSASNQIRKIGRIQRRDKPRVWDLFKAHDLSEHEPELCLQCLPEVPGYSPRRRTTRRAWKVHRPQMDRESNDFHV